MTAKEVADALKPHVIIGPLAERAGFSQSAWYAAVSRERKLSKDECIALRGALKELRQTIRDIEKRIK